jgi:hypothetical protein
MESLLVIAGEIVQALNDKTADAWKDRRFAEGPGPGRNLAGRQHFSGPTTAISARPM